MNRMRKNIWICVLLLLLSGISYAGEHHGYNYGYRGRRSMGHNSYVKEFTIVRIYNMESTILIEFSYPVDPRSVKAEHIEIDGVCLPKDTELKYNKIGNVLMFELPQAIQNICKEDPDVSISGIISYNGLDLE